jgi:phosphoserine phosphatase
MESISELIDLEELSQLTRKLVVFDLDGTLVEGDLGETVFYLLIIMQALGYSFEDTDRLINLIMKSKEIAIRKGNHAASFLQAYLTSLDQGSYIDAYRLTAEYYLNFSKEKILLLTRKVLEKELGPQHQKITLGDESFTLKIHARREPGMKSLLFSLLDRGASLMIISASPQWAVEEFCLYEGIPVAYAHGAQKNQEGGIDVPYGKRKLEIIRTYYSQPPFMVFGNSQGDVEMLEAAIHPFVRKTSQVQLLEKAKKLHWRTI